MNKAIGKILIASGILLALSGIYRGFFYAPNDALGIAPDGLVDATQTASAVSSGTITGSKSSNTSVSGSAPVRLLIPKLNINTNVQALGITKKGNMAAPNNFTDVSWYKYGTLPGNVGSAVMAGHEDNAVSLDGVFKHLEDLDVGDDVYVENKDGTKLHFRVTDKKVYPYNLSGPELEKVFGAKDARRLNLITCTGHWVEAIKTNNQRLIIFTELVK